MARGRLLEIAQLASHAPGAVVIREGLPVEALGIVVEGRVAIRPSVPGRPVTTILTVEPGDCIGWSALVSPYRATASVIALEPATILAFESAALRAALEAEPELAALVLRRVLEAVGRRLQATRTQLLDLLFAQSTSETWP